MLKLIRTKNNLTLDELGVMLGVNKGQISNWENGKRFPSLKSLHRLSNVLEYDFVKFAINENGSIYDNDGQITTSQLFGYCYLFFLFVSYHYL